MKRFFYVIPLLGTYLFSCQNLPFGNVCANKDLMQEVRLQTAAHIWAIENPGEALATVLFGGFTALAEGTDKFERELVSKIKPIEDALQLKDVSKPTKLSEGQYQCSALFTYKDKRIAVLYSMKRFHSGKDTVYEVKLDDIKLVR